MASETPVAPMSALTPQDKRRVQAKAWLQAMGPSLRLALPRHLTPEKMARVTFTALLRNPALLECLETGEGKASLAQSVMECAQLGLYPDGMLGHAYILPFRNHGKMCAQLIPGYKGYIRLARNSGELASIDAHEVREADEFEYEYGSNAHLKHKPFRGGDRGKVVASYAIAKLKSGEIVFHVCERSDIDAAKARSKAKDSGPWITDEGPMAMKTAVRRLAKFLPLSPDLERAVALEEAAENGELPDLMEAEMDSQEPAALPAGRETAAVDLSAVKPGPTPPPRDTKPAPAPPTEPVETTAEAPTDPAPAAAPTLAPRNGERAAIRKTFVDTLVTLGYSESAALDHWEAVAEGGLAAGLGQRARAFLDEAEAKAKPAEKAATAAPAPEVRKKDMFAKK